MTRSRKGVGHVCDHAPAIDLTQELCPRCDEPIDPAEDTNVSIPDVPAEGPAKLLTWHGPCFGRQIVGGLNHLMQLCSCYGGEAPPDPPMMTKREAAKAAVDYFNTHHGHLRTD
jgi:hypothetical protein